MPSPWVQDARDIEATKELTRSSLLQTDEIKDFLATNNSAKTVVIAPKGCGKTLLIKHKRKSIERSGIKLLPENKLVDVAPAHAPPFEQAQVNHIREDPKFWSMLWQISITISVIKHHRNINADQFQAPVKQVFENYNLRDSFQIFSELLRTTPKLFFAAFDDYNSLLLPIYSQIHSGTAVFIDNVDEYFSHHLINQKRHGLFGQLAEDFWFDSQNGLLMAIHQLSSQNPHIKTYAAIRSEAFNAKKSDLPDLANLRAHIFSIRLEYDELKAIFENNISLEKHAKLIDPHATDPFVKFFGAENVTIRHPYTGKKEFMFDYILRHTLARPRDLMTIGTALSSLQPNKRNAENIRKKVNLASAEVAESYLGEASPHHNWFDENILFNLLDANVIADETLERVSTQYEEDMKSSDSDYDSGPGQQAFSDLYHSGLVGIIEKSVQAKKNQKFVPVYDAAGTRRQRRLPQSTHYLIHPVLGSHIKEVNSRFWKSTDSVNIINPDSEWQMPGDLRFVLQADICQYTDIIKDSALKEAFPQIFDSILASARDGIEFFEKVGGDGFAFADRNGYLLIKAAQQIAAAVKASIFNAEIRFGLDYGIVRFFEDENTTTLGPDIAAQRSARLQYASAPGYVLMPAQVHEALRQYDVNWPFFELSKEDDRFRASHTDNGWDVGKDDEETLFDTLISLCLHNLDVE